MQFFSINDFGWHCYAWAWEAFDKLYQNGLRKTLGTTTEAAKTLSMSYGDGTYEFRVRAYDKAGNVGEWSNAFAVVLDTTPPQNIFVDSLPQHVNYSNILINGIVIDAEKISAAVFNGAMFYGKYDGIIYTSPRTGRTKVYNNFARGATQIIVNGDYSAADYNYFEFLGHKGEYSIIGKLHTDGFTTLTFTPGLRADVNLDNELNQINH